MTVKRPVHFVLETGSLAGGVRVVGELANRLAERGWPVAIWSVNPKETMTAWFQLNALVKWHSFLRTGTTADYAQLISVLGKQDGIKVATFYRTAFAVTDACKADEGYYLVQDVETSYTSQPIMSDLVMKTYGLPLRKITTSRWVESQLPDMNYIGIGLENKYRPNPKMVRSRYILACARIQALKGWDILCETFRYLATANARLVTFGLNDKDKLPMIAKTEQITKPTDDQIRRLYQEAGVFLSTSLHEGFNLTLLEAMACGTPAVTTDSDGNREYIEPGENCLVSQDPFELATLTVDLLRNRDLLRKLSENGPKTASRYRWADVINRVENLFVE